jgi:FdhE protein
MAIDHMPPLPVSGQRPPTWRRVFDAMLDQLDRCGKPAAMAAGAGELRALDAAQLEGCADAVLAELTEGVHPLHAPFVAAACK